MARRKKVKAPLLCTAATAAKGKFIIDKISKAKMAPFLFIPTTISEAPSPPEPCFGARPLTDPDTGEELTCGLGGPSGCGGSGSGGSYCHSTGQFSKCCPAQRQGVPFLHTYILQLPSSSIVLRMFCVSCIVVGSIFSLYAIFTFN